MWINIRGEHYNFDLIKHFYISKDGNLTLDFIDGVNEVIIFKNRKEVNELVVLISEILESKTLKIK